MNRTMPLVSVVIPVYNVALYVGRAIESTLHQTYQNIELVLVNDGSSDGSGNICEEYAANHDNVKMIHQENQGVSAARNTGLDSITGEYVVFLDADDALAPDAVTQMITAMATHKTGLAIGGMKFTRIKKDKQDTLYDFVKTTAASSYSAETQFKIITCKDLLTRSYLGYGTEENFTMAQSFMSTAVGRLYKCSVIRDNQLRFDENLVAGEDGLFFLSYLSCIENICFLDKIVYLYYRYFDRAHANETQFVDLYELAVLYYTKQCKVVQEQYGATIPEAFYQSFFNHYVAFLTKSAAYVEAMPRFALYHHVRKSMRNPFVAQASRLYQPAQREHSVLLPVLFRYRQAFLFYLVLLKRGRAYRKTQRKRAMRFGSIYRNRQCPVTSK